MNKKNDFIKFAINDQYFIKNEDGTVETNITDFKWFVNELIDAGDTGKFPIPKVAAQALVDHINSLRAR